MNPDSKATKPAMRQTINPVLNDIGFRLILIPFFGIVIPLITGIVDHDSFSDFQLKLSYLYTILLAFLIWQGNRYLLFTLRSYFNWYNKPVKKISALLLAVSFYTIPLSMLMLTGWYHIFERGIVDWDKVYLSTSIIMICVIFITHVYETVFLVRDSENEMIRNEQLEKAKAEAQLEALKNQIDPHFIFNSLNTLSHLIEHDPVKARKFNDTLAGVYRYILQNKIRDLVLLREELAFVSDYFTLLEIRFGKSVSLQLDIATSAMDNYLIPPISIQTLVENAIKHNEFSNKKPVQIDIRLEGDQILVCNNLNKVKRQLHSAGIGLKNLSARYELITSKRMAFEEKTGHFSVSLPVLNIKQASHESINC